MKEFVVYTVLRLALFVATYLILAGIWLLLVGQEGVVLVPLVVAAVVSSLASLRLLAPQRLKFAAVVEARASRAAAAFEERKAREDEPD